MIQLSSSTTVSSFSSEKYLPQVLQFQYALLPASVQVAATAACAFRSCPSAATSSVLVSSQTLQVNVFTPFSVHVGSVVTTPASHSWPFAGISSRATSTSLHTEQCLPSVRPVSVQVGATASSVTSVWPFASITQLFSSTSVSPFSSEKYLPHLSQFQYALLPASVQVASTAACAVRLCPSASTSSVLVSSQTLHVNVFTPFSVHVGSVVMTPSSHS